MKTTKTVFPQLAGSKILFQKDSHKRNDLLYGITQIGRIIVAPEYHITRTHYDAFALLYVKSGRLTVISNGETYTAGPGDLIFHDQSKPHVQRTDISEPLAMDFMYVFGGNVRGFFDMFYRSNGCLLKNYDGELFERTIDTVTHEIENDGDDIKISAAIYAMLADLLHYCDSGETADDEIASIIDYVCDHFDEQIETGALARKFYIDKFYLIRKFRARTGYTPREYVARLRFRRAKELLAKTDLSVADIASAVGFNDAKRLNELFAANIDLTPTEFRATVRAKNDNRIS